MTGKQLRNSILQWAIQGKLVPQDPNDEPASILLERIRAEKARLVKEKKIKRDKNESIIYRGEDNSYYEKMADGTVRCIDSEIPFDIPDSWAWCRFFSVASIARGGSPRPIKEYLTNKEDGVNWIKIGDTEKGGKYINSTKEKIKPSGVSKSRMVYKGDFLLTNSMSFGRPYITNICGCIHDGWLVISPYKNSFNQDFLYHLLSSDFSYQQFAGVVSGAVVQNLNSDKVANALIPLPPINEQSRIAAMVERITPFIEDFANHQILLEKLNRPINDALKKSILQEAIQGRLVPQIASEGTAEQLLEEIDAEKKRLVKEGKLKKSALTASRIFRGDDNKYYEQIGSQILDISEYIPFTIPDSWAWCHLTAIGISELGKTMNKRTDNGLARPYLCSINVYWDGITTQNLKLAKFSDVEMQKYRLNPNDILICEGGDVGRCAIWTSESEMYYQNALHRVRLFSNILPQYLVFILQYYKAIGFIDKISKGMTIKHFTQNCLNSLYLPMPPFKEQKRIVNTLMNLFDTLK